MIRGHARQTAAALIAVATAVFSTITPALAACDDLRRLSNYAGRQIRLLNDTLLFSANSLAMDIDGHPSAYGVRDQGYEGVCNGLSALKPKECRGQAARGKCWDYCRSAFSDWHNAGGDLTDMRSYMASVGLGGGGGSPPRLLVQDGDRSEWFVSETATKFKIGNDAPTWADIREQSAQIDPSKVPYFVIPGGFRHVPWDATPGDFGVMVSPSTGRKVYFIVGDVGGALDEVSVLLRAKIGGLDKPPIRQATSALGQQVERLSVGVIPSDLRVAIFRHSGIYKGSLGSTKVLDQPDGDVVEWIDEKAGDLLESFGGVDKVTACTDQ